jgi:uncharacterized protein (DUF305 family)
MKNIFKKGLVVLLASLFVTGVFAAEATTTVTTAAGAAPVAQHEHVAKHKHCAKKHCHTVNGKKVCKKACKHHKHAVKKADVAKKADAAKTAEPVAAEATK